MAAFDSRCRPVRALAAGLRGGRRHSADDTGEIDLVLRRSADDGRTRGPMSVIGSAPGYTWGNPAPVVDPVSGDVVLLSVRNPAEATEEMISVATDGAPDRSVWRSAYRDARRDPGRSRRRSRRRSRPMTGPGTPSARVTASHCGTDRTPGGSWCPPTTRWRRRTADEELPRYHGAHALLTDDGGQLWRDPGSSTTTTVTSPSANESAVAELPDRTLHFKARNHRGTGAPRLFALSPTAASRWSARTETCPTSRPPEFRATSWPAGQAVAAEYADRPG